MIIAFYPGAGGNRFYKFLQGQTEFESNKGYDQSNPFQTYANRYPNDEQKSVQHSVIFTHCMNYNMITKCWPGHDSIYFISSDRVNSIRRQWQLFQKLVSTNQHPVGGPFSTICWHHEYYTKYPWSPGPGIVVNNSNFPKFTSMMQQELNSIVSPEFDFAQQMFEQHGPNAPILELYKKHNDT
jgi:hypothetical protein